jgi:hypothetical protein
MAIAVHHQVRRGVEGRGGVHAQRGDVVAW